MNPYQPVADFEQALCEYTGSTYAVAVSSCTAALKLACQWRKFKDQAWYQVSIPKFTYCSVPQAIKTAGHRVGYRNEDWIGSYELEPLNVWDSARWFTSELYTNHYILKPRPIICVSFHASKTLGIGYGGAILHDDEESDVWFRKMRFHGRTEGVAPNMDKFDMIGDDCRLHPMFAALGLQKLHSLPKKNDPLPNDPYPDLSKIEIFK